MGIIDKQIQLSESIQTAVPSNVSAIEEIDEALRKYTDLVKNMKAGHHPDTRKVSESYQDKSVSTHKSSRFLRFYSYEFHILFLRKLSKNHTIY